MSATPFAEKIAALRLKNHPADKSPAEIVDGLLALRFPFTRESIGEPFIRQVRETLSGLPYILLQILDHKKIHVELDLVCEIAAILDMAQSRLWVSRYFLIDTELFETENNPIFPYGLSGVMLHEMAHLLDWSLQKPGRVSGLATFKSAFAGDVAALPKELMISHEERVALCALHGGYLKLPETEKERADVALFSLQEEETFADAFAYLMTGTARPAVAKHFQGTIEATRSLLAYYLAQVSQPA